MTENLSVSYNIFKAKLHKEGKEPSEEYLAVCGNDQQLWYDRQLLLGASTQKNLAQLVAGYSSAIFNYEHFPPINTSFDTPSSLGITSSGEIAELIDLTPYGIDRFMSALQQAYGEKPKLPPEMAGGRWQHQHYTVFGSAFVSQEPEEKMESAYFAIGPRSNQTLWGKQLDQLIQDIAEDAATSYADRRSESLLIEEERGQKKIATTGRSLLTFSFKPPYRQSLVEPGGRIMTFTELGVYETRHFISLLAEKYERALNNPEGLTPEKMAEFKREMARASGEALEKSRRVLLPVEGNWRRDRGGQP